MLRQFERLELSEDRRISTRIRVDDRASIENRAVFNSSRDETLKFTSFETLAIRSKIYRDNQCSLSQRTRFDTNFPESLRMQYPGGFVERFVHGSNGCWKPTRGVGPVSRTAAGQSAGSADGRRVGPGPATSSAGTSAASADSATSRGRPA